MEEIQEAEELTDLEKNSEIPEGDEELPDFMKDVDESEMQPGDNIGAFRGTAYHRVLELLDFAGCPEREMKNGCGHSYLQWRKAAGWQLSREKVLV